MRTRKFRKIRSFSSALSRLKLAKMLKGKLLFLTSTTVFYASGSHLLSQYINPNICSGSSNRSSNENIEEIDSKTLRIGLFEIDLDSVTVKGIITMRRILPREEYRLIKNRKCARVSRRKRKEK